MRHKKAKVAAEEALRASGATDVEASDLGNASELDSTLDAEEEVPSSPGGNASPPSPPASPRLPDIRPGVRLQPLAAPKLAPLPQGAQFVGGSHVTMRVACVALTQSLAAMTT